MSNLTITQFAEAKRLPVDFLAKHDVKQNGAGIVFTYFDDIGDLIAEKRRTALAAKDGTFWPKGQPLAAYGLWRLDQARKAGELFLVEGESDTLTLWLHGLPALGIPGASAGKCLKADYLAGITKLYISREPDRGGEMFVTGVLGQLHSFGWDGQAFELTMPDGVKDPNELHVRCGDDGGFIDDFKARVNAAKQLWPAASTNSTTASAKGKDEPKPQPVILTMSNVIPKTVRWLWRHRIPLGAITILDGDPGLGKSTITIDLAARVSRGWQMPPDGGESPSLEPRGVLLLSAEDDAENTIRPRLDAADADPSRVHVLESIKVGDETSPPVLPWDLGIVEDIVAGRGVHLVVVDPFMAFLGGELDAHKDQDVRRCLHKLKELACRTGAAIVLVRHLNKLGHGIAIYRGGGSIGITGAARSALLVGTDPEDRNVKLLASVKSNLGPMPKSLIYSLETVGDVARISWGGESDLTANDLLTHPGGKKKSAGEQAAEQLADLLAEGPRTAKDVEEHLGELGYSENAIESARRKLKIRASKSSYDGGWILELPPREDGKK